MNPVAIGSMPRSIDVEIDGTSCYECDVAVYARGYTMSTPADLYVTFSADAGDDPFEMYVDDDRAVITGALPMAARIELIDNIRKGNPITLTVLDPTAPSENSGRRSSVNLKQVDPKPAKEASGK